MTKKHKTVEEIEFEKAEECLDIYLNYTGWIKSGTHGTGINKKERKYLLFVGRYEKCPDVRVTESLLGKVFRDSKDIASNVIGNMVNYGYFTSTPEENQEPRIGLTETGRTKYYGQCMHPYHMFKDLPISNHARKR